MVPMEFKDYYALLGVEKSTSTEDIKRTYRKLARKYHPDVNPGDQEAAHRFAQINEAHEVLTDPERRAKYDRLELSWRTLQEADGQQEFEWDQWITDTAVHLDDAENRPDQDRSNHVWSERFQGCFAIVPAGSGNRICRRHSNDKKSNSSQNGCTQRPP